MPEFRFQGTLDSGKTLQGNLSANNVADAKRKIQEMTRGKAVRITKLEKRASFLYKIRKGQEAPITGEQKAFSKNEVVQGLKGMGYDIIYVRKAMFAGGGKPPVGEVITFVRLSADLLREKLPFNEVLSLLSNDIDNKSLREALKDINADLRQGKESERVFQKHENELGKFTARMLGLASKSGAMAEMYDSTAKFLERKLEFRKNMKSAMVMPGITLFVLLITCVFYVAYVFPETANMFLKYGIELPPMTAATLKFSDWLIANLIYLTLGVAAIVVAVIMFVTNPKGRLWVDKVSFHVPVMGQIIHKSAIEVFCRVFYSLYSGSGENIDVIKTAAEATGNKYFENQIRTITIPMMLQHGQGLHESLEASGVFTKTALSRFHAGAETGMVRETALQLAGYYERETSHKLKSVVDVVQLWVTLLIMIVMTAITIVSSETAVVKPKTEPGVSMLPTLLFGVMIPFKLNVDRFLTWLNRRRAQSGISTK
jgi:type IV pilus assembly protein PilC